MKKGRAALGCFIALMLSACATAAPVGEAANHAPNKREWQTTEQCEILVREAMDACRSASLNAAQSIPAG